ncbi:hypothetical protein GQS52_08945 [Streptomyces sp. SCUT-3]|uniref:EI24 domain-containing protein n=1 Tax=unclassified Streptomyces TaxID=2593676 RepID=UPI0015FCE556|nr:MULTISPECIES: EI24 domain-containing protein [unclassified Streptomyces]MCZ2527694.1 EI24 domain-containing protein [Streptomyces sp. HB2AG]QMV21889.1 hypothetical protein GQS52_08945 [Streptomyces sp. SCUT-3]
MRDLAAGFGYLMKGQRWVARHTRWWGFGMIPALVSLVLYAGALAVLGFWADDAVAWATPFADDWGSPWQSLVRGTLVVLLFGAGLGLAVLTFTAVTLLVGSPFYESLAERVEELEGGGPDGPDTSLWHDLVVGARDSLVILFWTALFGVLLFACGFVPVIGQTAVPAVGFCVSGFFLAAELTSVPLQRRGIPLKERLRRLRGHKMLSLGFGVPLVLLFLLPFVAVLAMPGAVAGATLMARERLTDQDGDGDGDGGGGQSGGSDSFVTNSTASSTSSVRWSSSKSTGDAFPS